MYIRQAIRILKTIRTGVFSGLPMAAQDRDPIEIFGDWIKTAEQSGLYLHESMTLATATPDGVPSARMVLLKGFGQNGFTFFTNYESRKAYELDLNPNAALVFHWNVLQRQIRIEGVVKRVSTEDSSSYFKTRPHGSRIAAWASRQSEVLPSRKELEGAYTLKLEEFGDDEVPLPDFWGGYQLQPSSIEFWQGRANRLHDRLRFRRVDTHWVSEWLYP
ncbi:MAG: pyridoxamine 5'-phosphate oxidase [Arenicellales bacterium]|nr:pyridoxamine 5'-phosphate oxidase [Arenicellales bacterium]